MVEDGRSKESLSCRVLSLNRSHEQKQMMRGISYGFNTSAYSVDFHAPSAYGKIRGTSALTLTHWCRTIVIFDTTTKKKVASVRLCPSEARVTTHPHQK